MRYTKQPFEVNQSFYNESESERLWKKANTIHVNDSWDRKKKFDSQIGSFSILYLSLFIVSA